MSDVFTESLTSIPNVIIVPVMVTCSKKSASVDHNPSQSQIRQIMSKSDYFTPLTLREAQLSGYAVDI